MASSPLKGPVAAWNFAEAALPYVDQQNGLALNLATVASAPVRKPDGFRPGVASLAFDGTDQHLTVPANMVGALQMGGAASGVTVAAWVRRRGDTNSAIAGIWPEDAQNPQRQYALFVNLALYGGDDRVCGHVSADGQVTPGYPYMRDYAWNARRIAPDGSDGWRFAVFTYDGSQICSYLDGGFEAIPRYTDIEGQTGPANPRPYTAGLNPTPAEFTVGAVRLTGGYGNFLHGEIAGLRVWDRALSQAEISTLYQAERPLSQPLFHDAFRTGVKVPTRDLGWRSFQGSTCSETTDRAPGDQSPEVYNFAGSGAGHGGYLARSPSAAGIGAGFYGGFLQAPLPLQDVGAVKWVMNNASPTAGVRVLLRISGRWVASTTNFHCTGDHTAQDWSEVEAFTCPLTRGASHWRAVTLVPEEALSLGAPLSADLQGHALEAFGFLCDDTVDGTLRIDQVELVGV
ncbi:LamG domain-containing protein [Cognatishimia sp. MH4019]|uniref:LamG domain-containing protein n=1 Tax=Cognatishimia sp. MH4019 TaxID=2854030 RepID=UPI001CD4A984|nr:LamG domain-containing protein [Cognatishimia sp. MH4019]